MLASETTGGSADTETPVEKPAGIVPATRAGRWLVVAILVLAMGIRFGAVYQNRPYAPKTDALSFDHIASALVNGHGFGYAETPPFTPAEHQPTALRDPMYPLTLAAVYVVFGDHSWTAARLVNSIVDTLVVLLIGVVAAQLWSRRIAVVAMIIAAVDPSLILVGTSLQLEPLLLLFSLGSLAATLQYRRSGNDWRWAAGAGLLLGLAILTRETAAVMLLPEGWLLWSAHRTKAGDPGVASTRPSLFTSKAVVAPVLLVVLAVATVVPWTIRNAVTLHAFVPTTTGAGLGLAGTYNATVYADHVNQGEWIQPWDDPKDDQILLSIKNPTEVSVDSAYRHASLTFIENHPSFPFRVALWNTERLFGFDRGHYSIFLAQYEPTSRSLTRVAIYLDYVLMLLAAIGFFGFRRARQVPWAIWAIPILAYLFIVFFLPAYIRYETFIEPYFIFLAAFPVAWAVESILSYWTARRVQLAPAPSAASGA